jgi:catechol 2,3-dioxygenase-like lactoylglutathione lyase family enzyme
MGFRVVSTNHTSFTVSSLDRSIGFFRDCLGFELVSRAPRDPAIVQKITGVAGADMEIAFLRGPGHTVELIEYKAPAAKGRKVVYVRDWDGVTIEFIETARA